VASSDRIAQRAFAAPQHRDGRARLAQRRRDRPADAAPAAGYQSMPPLKQCHESPLRGLESASTEITLSFKFLGFKNDPGACAKIILSLK
jgi:hypothetical protein